METILSQEKQRAAAIAEEYRSKGYEVIEKPIVEQLPDFLSGFHPDLLVRKDDEAIVVEVRSRKALAQEPQIRDLARLLHARPKWNFELVLVGGEEEQIAASRDAQPLKKEDIQHGVETAEKLLESGFTDAALMQAWSISEAVVRLLTEAEGVSYERLAPVHILKEAVANGAISREDYNFLTSVKKHRNALAHGFKTIGFDAALVKELVGTTKRLAQQTTPAA